MCFSCTYPVLLRACGMHWLRPPCRNALAWSETHLEDQALPAGADWRTVRRFMPAQCGAPHRKLCQVVDAYINTPGPNQNKVSDSTTKQRYRAMSL